MVKQKNIVPAIVVVAYNRPHSLNRLLQSINNAIYEQKEIPLIISIDKSNDGRVEQIAEEFIWKYGKKIIIKHDQNLGLRKHIILCGDLSEEYQDIIILEDDMFVAPYFYDFATKALCFYKNEEKICGISLYSYDFSFNNYLRFVPIEDGYSTYFIQYASSLGQIWNKKWWNSFKNWYLDNDEINKNLPIPNSILNWPSSSWLKYFNAFMVEHDLYYVFPRLSFATNFSSDPGTHHKGLNNNNNFQVNLLIGIPNDKFAKIEQSQAIYDVYFELKSEILKKWVKNLEEYEFEVDIYGTKEFNKINSEYLISSRFCKKPIFAWDLNLIPNELNIRFNNLGSNLYFGKKNNFRMNPINVNLTILRNYHKALQLRQYLKLLKQPIKNKLIQKMNLILKKNNHINK